MNDYKFETRHRQIKMNARAMRCGVGFDDRDSTAMADANARVDRSAYRS
ncbi:hypothetical protein [Burkholderia sp. S-53]|nr:hypothetical protein [Burkholderia sp. S-53]UXU88687.1 hypothetical protein LXM88_09550 [Burkholderia sp. S-53]